MTEVTYTIEVRLARLERHNKLLGAGLVLCLALLALSVGKGQDGLRAESFQLVDADGAVQAELVSRDGVPGLYLMDAQSRTRLALFHGADTTGLYVNDEEEVTRVGVAQFSHGGGGFALHGPQSKGAVALYLKGEGSLRFFDTEGNVTRLVAATADAAGKD